MVEAAGTGGERKQRRPRRSNAVAEQLAALKGNRDELDADKAERERAENAALEKYAKALVRVDEINAERSRKVTELAEQTSAVHAQAQRDIADTELTQGDALAELSGLGRSAEDIARVVHLPVKRVRAMIKAADDAKRPASALAERVKPVKISQLAAAQTGGDHDASSGTAGAGPEVPVSAAAPPGE